MAVPHFFLMRDEGSRNMQVYLDEVAKEKTQNKKCTFTCYLRDMMVAFTKKLSQMSGQLPGE
jgi:hypothetical protein